MFSQALWQPVSKMAPIDVFLSESKPSYGAIPQLNGADLSNQYNTEERRQCPPPKIGHKRHSRCFFLGSLPPDSQLQCHEDIQAALWRGSKRQGTEASTKIQQKLIGQIFPLIFMWGHGGSPEGKIYLQVSISLDLQEFLTLKLVLIQSSEVYVQAIWKLDPPAPAESSVDCTLRRDHKPERSQ